MPAGQWQLLICTEQFGYRAYWAQPSKAIPSSGAPLVCVSAGSTFELIAIATSRAGVNRQVFAEELINTVCLQEPATGESM
jgi:hypothetical protein